jgi:hypothetical protein
MLIQEEFAPFLSMIVPHMIQSCKLEEKDFFGNEAALNDLSRHFSAEEDGDEDEDAAFNVNSAIVEEKETSLQALAELFSATKAAFSPYVEEAVNIAIKLLEHYHENVRKSAISCLLTIIQTFYKMYSPDEWAPGFPLAVPLHNDVANLVRVVMEGVYKTLEDEDDK